MDRQFIVARDLLGALPHVDPLENGVRRHERLPYNRPAERNSRIDHDRLRVRAAGQYERIETYRRMKRTPLHPLEVRLEYLSHGELPRGGEVQQLTVTVEEELPTRGAQFLAKKELLDSELTLGEPECFSNGDERNSVLGAQRSQHVSFNEV